jgi:sugar phosphate isomerase/epimerase
VTRRSLILALAAGKGSAIRLEIGNYGMQALAVEAAIEQIRRIGYDGAELCLMPGWPSEPKALAAADRRRIRDTRFPIPTMIESLNLMATDEAHLAALDRIRGAATLAHDLNPADPPILQTVMGGKAGDWPAIRDKMAAKLADWGKVAADSKIKLAVKAHAMNAVDTPAKLLSLLDQVNNPAIVAIYDYGHFQLRDLTIEETMDAMLGRSSFITVKDSKVVDGKPQFLLPGEGTIDYARYFRKVKAVGWKGWVLVEVSSQLFRQPGYDPIRAAEKSYSHLAPILASSGLR